MFNVSHRCWLRIMNYYGNSPAGELIIEKSFYFFFLLFVISTSRCTSRKRAIEDSISVHRRRNRPCFNNVIPTILCGRLRAEFRLMSRKRLPVFFLTSRDIQTEGRRTRSVKREAGPPGDRIVAERRKIRPRSERVSILITCG